MAQRVLAYTLDALLRLLHPIIPFLTEEVWQLLGQVAPARGLATVEPAAESIIIAAWPVVIRPGRTPRLKPSLPDSKKCSAACARFAAGKACPRRDVSFSVRCDGKRPTCCGRWKRTSNR